MDQIPNTLFIGKEIYHLEKVNSTNTFLKELIQKNGKLGEGLLVISDEQFSGRGQSGNTWVSEPGKNITASILLYPQFLEARQVFYFNKAVALAVRECITSVISKNRVDEYTVTIKWPNDILIDLKKVAGILIENSFRNNGIEYAISGIGINVNQIFGEDVSFNAISLREVCGKEINLNEVLGLLCGILEKYYLILKRFDFNLIDNLYHSYLFGMKMQREFISDKRSFKGAVAGVNKDGQLIVEIEGEEKTFMFKEIEWVL